MAGHRCEACGDPLDADPDTPGAGPQRRMCRQCRRRFSAADAITLDGVRGINDFGLGAEPA